MRPSPWRSGEGRTDRQESAKAPVCPPGVAGTARCEGWTLNTGDLVRIGWQPKPRHKAQAKADGPGEKSDGSVVPVTAVKAARGKGPYSTMRPLR